MRPGCASCAGCCEPRRPTRVRRPTCWRRRSPARRCPMRFREPWPSRCGGSVRCSPPPAAVAPIRAPNPCSGRCGRCPVCRTGWSRPRCAAAGRASTRTRPSTPWSRCSSTPPSSPSGCRAPASAPSSTTCSDRLIADGGAPIARTEAVAVLSAHAAKGLEWDVVAPDRGDRGPVAGAARAAVAAGRSGPARRRGRAPADASIGDARSSTTSGACSMWRRPGPAGG